MQTLRPASHQSGVAADKLLNSINAGFLVHRVGDIKHEYRTEGIQFAAELVSFINPAQQDHVSVFVYEEVFGDATRLHWLLHLKQPNDYQRLLEMVDHDEKWRIIADMDRLPTKGGGGWERMFIDGSIQETVMCPQHGLGHGEDDGTTFQPPARFQTTVPDNELLHSANSPLTIHRVFGAQYALREEARLYCYEWAAQVTATLQGKVSAFLYEEMWGKQDRLHMLIHAKSLDAVAQLQQIEKNDPELGTLMNQQWVPTFKGGGSWDKLFVNGSIHDTILTPIQV